MHIWVRISDYFRTASLTSSHPNFVIDSMRTSITRDSCIPQSIHRPVSPFRLESLFSCLSWSWDHRIAFSRMALNEGDSFFYRLHSPFQFARSEDYLRDHWVHMRSTLASMYRCYWTHPKNQLHERCSSRRDAVTPLLMLFYCKGGLMSSHSWLKLLG